MLSVFRKLAARFRSATPRAGSNPRRFAPRVEALNDRITPAVYTVGGHLIIFGTEFADTVTVARVGDNYLVTESDNRYVPGKVKPGPTTTSIPAAVITGDMEFRGYGRDDYFANLTALICTANGGEGNDTLFGGSSRDTLYGEAGHDYLDGGSGSDKLYGADGHDRIYAGSGDSPLDFNTLDGSFGNDTLIGSLGGDHIYGGNDNDLMRAGDLDLNGNYLDGGRGDDTLYGGDGPDRLYGGDGADLLRGRGGRDALFGGAHKDRLFGDAGDDYLNGGVGDNEADFLHGGTGRDTFAYDLHKVDSWWPWAYEPPSNDDSPHDFDPTDDVVVY